MDEIQFINTIFSYAFFIDTFLIFLTFVFVVSYKGMISKINEKFDGVNCRLLKMEGYIEEARRISLTVERTVENLSKRFNPAKEVGFWTDINHPKKK